MITFIAALVGSVAMASAPRGMQGTNWSKNIWYSADGFVAPADVWEVKRIFDMHDVRHMKVVGTKHSFNDIADTDGVLLSLKRFKSIEFNKATNQVTFGAGWTYSDLIEELKK